MIPLQNDKKQQIIFNAALATNGTVTSSTIDASGFDHAQVVFLVNGGAGTALSPSAVQLQESDTDAATAYANISGLTGGTSSYATQVTAATSTTNTSPFLVVDVDLKKRKRYLRALVTGNNVGTGVTANVVAFALLGRATQAPTSAAGVGYQTQWTA